MSSIRARLEAEMATKKAIEEKRRRAKEEKRRRVEEERRCVEKERRCAEEARKKYEAGEQKKREDQERAKREKEEEKEREKKRRWKEIDEDEENNKESEANRPVKILRKKDSCTHCQHRRDVCTQTRAGRACQVCKEQRAKRSLAPSRRARRRIVLTEGEESDEEPPRKRARGVANTKHNASNEAIVVALEGIQEAVLQLARTLELGLASLLSLFTRSAERERKLEVKRKARRLHRAAKKTRFRKTREIAVGTSEYKGNGSAEQGDRQMVEEEGHSEEERNLKVE